MIRRITRAGNTGIRLVTALLAAVLMIYGLLSLWDMTRTGYKAFASYDLMKYRPELKEDEPPDLHEITRINPDTVGWITLYGTNIDYPIMQGRTDMEYINKDTYGNHSISGSVFLSCLNKRDFSEPYELVYGHHMDNGAMFGDLDKFADEDFFENAKNIRPGKLEGLLMTERKTYKLRAFAFLKTDAFDEMIYKAEKDEADLKELLSYVDKKADLTRDVGKISHVLALSTCDSGSSYGRMVLLLKATDLKGPLPEIEKEIKSLKRNAAGHDESGAGWAILDLLLVMLNIYLVRPLHAMREIRAEKSKGTTIACLLICIVLEALFLIKEDMMRPVGAVGSLSPLMLAITASSWILQYMRYIKIGKVTNE